ncbi:MAG: S1C family serine protease [Lachnospiraceae bacterium]
MEGNDTNKPSDSFQAYTQPTGVQQLQEAADESQTIKEQFNSQQYDNYQQNTQIPYPQQLNSPPPEYEQRRARRHRKREERRMKHESKKKGFFPTLFKWTAAAAVLGVVCGGGYQGIQYLQKPHTDVNATADISDSSEAQPEAFTSVSEVAEHAMPSIVAITNTSQQQRQTWFGVQTYEGQSAGSGIIVSQDAENLYIATNNHVVSNSKSMSVCFNDDSTASATVKGTDAAMDLAVVKVKMSDISEETQKKIRIATLGDSKSLQVGESAIAIGNALGSGQSVTAGTISAVNREVTLQDEESGKSITNTLIQTDTAINPGNSGGALLNTKGEVVGINSAKFSGDEIEGMGYAIPMETAQPLIENLITREVVAGYKSAYLGVTGVDVTSDVAKTYNKPEGIYISKVEKLSAADNAGLVAGDIITKFDGHKVTSMDDLLNLLQYYEAGAEVDIVAEVSDGGSYKEKTFHVVLGLKH